MEDDAMSLSILDHHHGAWTVDDLLRLPASNTRIELQDGNLVVSPRPEMRHQRVSLHLASALLRHVEPALTVVQEIDVVLGPLSLRIPDVLVVHAHRGKATAADVVIAIEIVSPTSRRTDRLLKPTEYAEAGIPHFWRVELDPDVSITAYSLDAASYAEVGTWGPGETLRVTEPLPIEIAIDSLRG